MCFAEQFEAGKHSLKLDKVLSRDATYLDYMQTVRNNSAGDQRRQAIEKGRQELEDKKKTLCYELVQSLDKTSILFLRQHKGDCTRAWDLLCKHFKSFERPQPHKLIAQRALRRLRVRKYGKVERNWRTITPMARCPLEQSCLEKEY